MRRCKTWLTYEVVDTRNNNGNKLNNKIVNTGDWFDCKDCLDFFKNPSYLYIRVKT